MKRTVTEQDFRAPEFVGKDVADYEFRPDGKLVRTDRWEMGMRAVAQVLGIESREGFEIVDVVRQVAELMAVPTVIPTPVVVTDDDWIDWNGGGCPVDDDMVEIRLRNGLLRMADPTSLRWDHSVTDAGGSDIVAYRLC